MGGLQTFALKTLLGQKIKKERIERKKKRVVLHTTISPPVLDPSLKAEGERPRDGAARLAVVMISTTSTPLLFLIGSVVVKVVNDVGDEDNKGAAGGCCCCCCGSAGG